MTTMTTTEPLELTTRTEGEGLTIRISVAVGHHYGRKAPLYLRPRQVLCQDLRGFNGCKSRLYVRVEGETLVEQMLTRRARPSAWYRSEIMPAVLKALGLDGTTFKWSQRAGCTMCPCSPGFILDAQELACHDIWVTVLDGDAPATVFEV